MSTTPYMSLTLPSVSVTAGPLYGTENNDAFTLIDSHTHISGQGLPVPTLGININADLTFASNNAIGLRSSRYINQGSPLALAADLDCVFFSGGEFYVNDGSGNHVQITSGGTVNSAAGNINGMGATTASVTYTVGNHRFTFAQDTNKPADLAIGNLFIGESGATSPHLIELSSPTSLSADYAMTFPGGLPAARKIMTLDNAGAIASVLDVDNSTLQISGNVLQIHPLGVTEGQLGAACVTTTKLGSNLNLPGNAVQANSHNVVVSNSNNTNSDAIVWGVVSSAGAIVAGTGFSVAHPGTGLYTITITNTYTSTPAVSATVTGSGIFAWISIILVGANAFQVEITDAATHSSNQGFQFVCVGQRP